MRVSISREAMEHPAAFRHLTAILWMFKDGRHRWVKADPRVVAASAWHSGEAEVVRRLSSELAGTSGRSTQSPRIIVLPTTEPTRREGSAWLVPAHVAEEYLRRPVTVVVENARCDGTFLRLIATRVGDRKLKDHLGEHVWTRLKGRWTNPLGDGVWIAVRHGGGSTTADQIELALEASPELPPALVVFVDSDRTTPADPDDPTRGVSGTAGKVVETCSALKDTYHQGWTLRPLVLTKHEVENYLPEEALRHRLTNHAKLTVWEGLPASQKDIEDLKTLFPRTDLWKLMTDPAYDRYFHERALRDRAGQRGRELDELIDRLIEQW